MMRVVLKDFKGKINDPSPSDNLTTEVCTLRLMVFDGMD
jgi:hypothetical protein